jgi:hypothetical protein
LTHSSAAPAAFLLDAVAAPPRKWVSDGAPTLPCIQERAAARLLWRRLYERRESFDSAVIDSRYKPARQRALAEDSFFVFIRKFVVQGHPGS